MTETQLVWQRIKPGHWVSGPWTIRQGGPENKDFSVTHDAKPKHTYRCRSLFYAKKWVKEQNDKGIVY